MIEFKCLHCNQVIRAQPKSAGMSSKCPRCKAKIKVPMPQQEELEIPPSPHVESPKPKTTTPPIPEKVTPPPLSERQPLIRNVATESSDKTSSDVDSDVDSDVVTNRYPALQILSYIYLIASGLAVIGTLVICFGLIYAGYTSKDDPAASAESLFAAIGYLFSGMFTVIVLLSISELIKVFLAIERNTRRE